MKNYVGNNAESLGVFVYNLGASLKLKELRFNGYNANALFTL
jgi:hypothetical protein